MDNRRITVLGKSGAGKSSLANTIFGEELFKIGHNAKSETAECKAATRCVNGRSITLIDTPGFFDIDKPEDHLRAEIVRCIVECAPGPHAFLLLLKVETYTKKEQDVIDEIEKQFSDKVFKYVTIVFSHGDQLEEGQTIEDYISNNKKLSDLVGKCGGRRHVIDNKYWQDNPKNEYRSNQFQVDEILKTIDKMIKDNNDGCYTNEMLQAVEEEIQQDMEDIRESTENMPEEEIREKAKKSTSEKLLIRLAGVATGAILGALVGAAAGVVAAVLAALRDLLSPAVAGSAALGEVTGGAAVAVVKTLGAPLIPVLAGSAAGLGAVAGAAAGGFMGYKKAEEADSPWEAVKMVAEAAKDQVMLAVKETKQHLEPQSH